MTTEKPILMCGEMVRALLREINPKRQMRRSMKHQPSEHWTPNSYGEVHPLVNGEPEEPDPGKVYPFGVSDEDGHEAYPCPYGSPGTRLWVRETWGTNSRWDDIRPSDLPISLDASAPHAKIYFAADYASNVHPERLDHWRPSIFMPRQASRITLEIESVRVERVQDISEADAKAEGSIYWWLESERDRLPNSSAREAYRQLWNSINLKPKPVYKTDENGKKLIVGYQSFPWSNEDFDAKYPGVRSAGLYRGQPLTVTGNCFVWVLSFRKV